MSTNAFSFVFGLNRQRSLMMFSKLLGILLAFGLAIPAWAHDPSKHKGKATQGEVISVSTDRFELKTAKGVKVVTLNDQTKFEHGDQRMTKTDLKKGDTITVIGTTLASGEIVAREVLMIGPGGQGVHKTDAEHNH